MEATSSLDSWTSRIISLEGSRDAFRVGVLGGVPKNCSKNDWIRVLSEGVARWQGIEGIVRGRTRDSNRSDLVETDR